MVVVLILRILQVVLVVAVVIMKHIHDNKHMAEKETIFFLFLFTNKSQLDNLSNKINKF